VTLDSPVDPFDDAPLRRAIERLRDCPFPWCVAGGWAIDCFLGVRTREHADVEFALLRRDQRQVHAHFAHGRLRKAVDRALEDWNAGEDLSLPVHEVHVDFPSGDRLELLLNESDADDWVYRRDPRVRMPLREAFLDRPGAPLLAPEIVLLYKSRHLRAVDHADFRMAAPALGRDRLRWLRGSLVVASPGHEWINALDDLLDESS